jgi:hypothetical protein
MAMEPDRNRAALQWTHPGTELYCDMSYFASVSCIANLSCIANVGQDGILRNGWQPPLLGSRVKLGGPIDNRPQVTNLPHMAAGRHSNGRKPPQHNGCRLPQQQWYT